MPADPDHNSLLPCSSGRLSRMARLSSTPVDFDETVIDMTTTGQHRESGRGDFTLMLTTRLLTRRRVIDQMRTASATCR